MVAAARIKNPSQMSRSPRKKNQVSTWFNEAYLVRTNQKLKQGKTLRISFMMQKMEQVELRCQARDAVTDAMQKDLQEVNTKKGNQAFMQK